MPAARARTHPGALAAEVSTSSTNEWAGPSASVRCRWLRKAPWRLSRNLVTRGWDPTTAHRACRDARSPRPDPPGCPRCGGLDKLDQRVGRSQRIRALPLVEEGALAPVSKPGDPGLGPDHRPSSLSR